VVIVVDISSFPVPCRITVTAPQPPGATQQAQNSPWNGTSVRHPAPPSSVLATPRANCVSLARQRLSSAFALSLIRRAYVPGIPTSPIFYNYRPFPPTPLLGSRILILSYYAWSLFGLKWKSTKSHHEELNFHRPRSWAAGCAGERDQPTQEDRRSSAGGGLSHPEERRFRPNIKRSVAEEIGNGAGFSG
jgi:hypothetical protein